MVKTVSVEEAVSYIKDGDIIAVNGMMWIGAAKCFTGPWKTAFLRQKARRALRL